MCFQAAHLVYCKSEYIHWHVDLHSNTYWECILQVIFWIWTWADPYILPNHQQWSIPGTSLSDNYGLQSLCSKIISFAGNRRGPHCIQLEDGSYWKTFFPCTPSPYTGHLLSVHVHIRCRKQLSQIHRYPLSIIKMYILSVLPAPFCSTPTPLRGDIARYFNYHRRGRVVAVPVVRSCWFNLERMQGSIFTFRPWDRY